MGTRFILAAAVAGTLLAGGAVVRAYQEARDAADGSCLAAVHAALVRGGVLRRAESGPEWRTWTAEEVREALAAVLPAGSCDASPQAEWRASMRLRSRRKDDGTIQAHLWLSGRPRVSSPWGWKNPD